MPHLLLSPSHPLFGLLTQHHLFLVEERAFCMARPNNSCKRDYAYYCPSTREKIKIIRLQLVASKYNSMWLYNENWNSVVSTIYPNHRNILILNEWGYTEHEKRLIFQRGLLDLLLPYWTLPSVHEIRDKMQFIYKELPCAWVKSKVA